MSRWCNTVATKHSHSPIHLNIETSTNRTCATFHNSEIAISPKHLKSSVVAPGGVHLVQLCDFGRELLDGIVQLPDHQHVGVDVQGGERLLGMLLEVGLHDEGCPERVLRLDALQLRNRLQNNLGTR